MSEKSFDETWEQIHSIQEWGQYPAEHVIRFVARNYYNRDRQTIKILDFGCGGGAHTWYLAREGFDVYAFDGSASAVRRAQERLKKEGKLRAHFAVLDALDLNYEDDFFDAIIDSACIYANTKDNIIKMYQETFDKLKKDGKLLSVCFGQQTAGYKSGETIEEGTYVNISEGVLAGRGTTHIFAMEELLDILQSIGFYDIKCDTILYTDNGNQVELYVTAATK